MSATAWLARTAERDLRAEAARHHDRETGGLLVGYWSLGEVFISGVLGPGPSANHLATSFLPDHAWQESELAREYAASGRRHAYLGDWHTHPGGRPHPSLRDRRTLAAIARHREARAPRALMAILAPDPDGQIGLWLHAGLPRRAVRLEWYPYG